MKYYLIEITTYADETPDAKGIYAYDTKDEAVANFHSKLGAAMKNANYASEMLTVLDSNNKVIKFEPTWVRPVVQPEPEPVVEPEENS